MAAASSQAAADEAGWAAAVSASAAEGALPKRERRRRAEHAEDARESRSEEGRGEAEAKRKKEAAEASKRSEEKAEAAQPEAGAAGFEYLDHTADIQLHAWGRDLAEAMEQVAVCMFGYMTELSTVEEDAACETEFEAEGHDEQSLLFNFLDEALFVFHTEGRVFRRIRVLKLDRAAFRVRAKGFGEKFDLAKHPQGTEVKAITYSAMQVAERPGRCDLFVIVDI